MFTPEQVRAYRSLEDQYPDHLPPRKLVDDVGVAGLYFVIQDVTDEMDCGGECGHEHVEYAVIEPINGEVVESMTGHTFRSNSFGEAMILGPFAITNERVEPVDAEDWPDDALVEAKKVENVDALLADILGPVESDPWLGPDF